jgi:hypothetical protein
MKMIFKSKINLIRKTLNFVSVQWSYLQAFSISWDYPFKKTISCRIRCLSCYFAPYSSSVSFAAYSLSVMLFRSVLFVCRAAKSTTNLQA